MLNFQFLTFTFIRLWSKCTQMLILFHSLAHQPSSSFTSAHRHTSLSPSDDPWTSLIYLAGSSFSTSWHCLTKTLKQTSYNSKHTSSGSSQSVPSPRSNSRSLCLDSVTVELTFALGAYLSVTFVSFPHLHIQERSEAYECGSHRHTPNISDDIYEQINKDFWYGRVPA